MVVGHLSKGKLQSKAGARHGPRPVLVPLSLRREEVCWDAPSQCAAKFRYKGMEYSGCTYVDSGPHAWCAFHHDYDSKNWSYCTNKRPCCSGDKAPRWVVAETTGLASSETSVDRTFHFASAGVGRASALLGALVAITFVAVRVFSTRRRLANDSSDAAYHEDNSDDMNAILE